MKKYFQSEVSGGELAVRRMSEKAQWRYAAGDPIHVYKLSRDGDEPTYDVDMFGALTEGLTFEQAEELLSADVVEPSDPAIIKLYNHANRPVYEADGAQEVGDLTLEHGTDGSTYWTLWLGNTQLAINTSTLQIVEDEVTLNALFR